MKKILIGTTYIKHYLKNIPKYIALCYLPSINIIYLFNTSLFL